MSYAEAKVYNDGGHYIAIPYVPNPFAKKRKVEKKRVVVSGEDFEFDIEELEENLSLENVEDDYVVEEKTREKIKQENKEKTEIKPSGTMLKELFESLYEKSLELSKKARAKYIIDNMREHFNTYHETESFVLSNIERKNRNLIAKKVRLYRKAYLQQFNYFCTFTYDDKKHTEESFEKKLLKTLRNFATRYGWEYIGVWERGGKTERLHFHAVVYIPEGQMVGNIFTTNTYCFSRHERKVVKQNTYFNEKFGRSDFEEIETPFELRYELNYMLKYLEKSGGKIVYSRGLPQFFISDIMDEDIVCPTGIEGRKLVLSDSFNCWDEGCLIGAVSPEVIEQMRKVS